MGEAFLLGRRSGKVFVGLIEVPVLSGQPVYTGAAITPTWTNYDPEKMTIGGAYSGTNAGTYYVTFTPKQGYYWSGGDGDDNVRVIPWTINKAAGTLSLSATSVTLDSGTTTTTVTVTKAGDGAISAVSNNTSVATVSVSGTTLTISSVDDTNGEAMITVSVAEGTNYAAPADKTIAVSAQFLLPLNDYSWGEISRIAETGLASSYFAVGDRKGILVNGQVGADYEDNSGVYNRTLYVYILGFDHNGASNCIDFGTFMTKAVDEIGDPNEGYDPYWGTSVVLTNGNLSREYTDGTKYYTMNHWGSYNHGGWKGCDLRYDILGSTDVAPSGYGAAVTAGRTGYDATPTCATNPVPNTLMAALPSDLRAVMKPMLIYTDNVGGTYEIDWGSDNPEQEALNAIAKDATLSIDYLPLLSPVELADWTFSANPAEANYQKQYAYYAAGNFYEKGDINADVNGNFGAPSFWWLRSPVKNWEWHMYDGFYSYVDMSPVREAEASVNLGIAPIFRV